MKEIITEVQRSIIEKLCNEDQSYADAIIANGAQLYHEGLVKGGVIGAGSVLLGTVVAGGLYVWNMKKQMIGILKKVEEAQALVEEMKQGKGS